MKLLALSGSGTKEIAAVAKMIFKGRVYLFARLKRL